MQKYEINFVRAYADILIFLRKAFYMILSGIYMIGSY